MTSKPNPSDSRIRIGTRGSELALWQARRVQSLLRERFPDEIFELEIIKTEGDTNQTHILYQPTESNVGIFTKALELALLEGRVDLAVHSLKDLPTQYPEGVALTAVPERTDVHDLWIQLDGVALEDLPKGGRVGTSSLRRRGQLRARRPDLEFLDIRGNVLRRVQILEQGDCDALILAAAGVGRLGIELPRAAPLPLDHFLPAPGQGAIGVQTRADDERIRGIVSAIHSEDVGACVTAERTFLEGMEGGCQVPLGAHATLESGKLTLHAMVTSPEGTPVLDGTREGDLSRTSPREIGTELARELLDRGAWDLVHGQDGR